MNYEMLAKLIPQRRLPDDHSAPLQKLHDMFRDLEGMRELQVEEPEEHDADLEKRIEFYERLLE